MIATKSTMLTKVIVTKVIVTKVIATKTGSACIAVVGGTVVVVTVQIGLITAAVISKARRRNHPRTKAAVTSHGSLSNPTRRSFPRKREFPNQ